jgi:hypothetical protein
METMIEEEEERETHSIYMVKTAYAADMSKQYHYITTVKGL